MSHLIAKKLLKQFFIGSLSLAAASHSFAGIGSSLMQTADVLAPGKIVGTFHGDLILNNGGGFNLSPHVELGLVDHYLDVDAWVGTGTTDFQLGSMAKYNILPDVEGQVGLSTLFGITLIRDEGLSNFLMTFGFVVSKKMEMSFGHLTPYAAFEGEALINSAATNAPLTLLGGGKWEFKDMRWGFYSELGMNIHQSVWSISAGATYPF